MKEAECVICARHRKVAARDMCSACYATWRRRQPGRCKYCGGRLAGTALAGHSNETHARCLERRRVTHAKYKLRALAGYGGTCVCCGETDDRFLTLDHVNGDGGRHRKTLGGGSKRLYLLVIREGFPSEYRVLCFNCNSGRQINGGVCPHQDPRPPFEAIGGVPSSVSGQS